MRSRTLKAVAILAFLLAPILAFAQGAVQQSGPFTSGHVLIGVANGIVADGGSSSAPKVSSLGIVGSGVPFCIYDAPLTSASGYHQLCLSADSLGGGLLSYNAFGNASQLPLQILVNGSPVTQPDTFLNLRDIGTFSIATQPMPTMGSNLPAPDWQSTSNLTNVTLALQTSLSSLALGQPTSGYLYTPETSAILGVFNNGAGWNQDTADNGGRTGGTFMRIFSTASGGGDTYGIEEEGQVSGVKAGATSFIANSAWTALAFDCNILVNGGFCQGLGDMNFNDNGNDGAVLPIVINTERTNNTGALNATWADVRFQSEGTKPIDAFISGVGLASIGIDFAGMTTTPFTAMTLPINSKIYLNSTNTDPDHFPQNTVPGNTYISYDGTQIVLEAAGNPVLQVQSNQINVNGGVNLAGLSGTGLIYNSGSHLMSLQFSGSPIAEIGVSTFNIVGNLLITGGAITVGSSPGLTCSGSPSSGFATVNGIVTHC
jgi:hypothetical protein